uniref:50S ribosomal protein L5, chloroplastic n=1 Tax=Olisthodiscus luteus TaxID=83000 RepID=A0A7U0KSU0_OLILU|nr:ribosomal protein L5 [Olisthodiscus luteus]QQW50584.1 ribosomal protein L5 [Olisthodiscus luteus]
MNQRLKKLYKEEIRSSLKEKFDFKNDHQIPKIVKIQINRGLGLDAQNDRILQKTIDEFRLITGQHPVVKKSKKSIAGFKIRDDMPLGVTVTLRNEKMYAFLDRLINLVFPRIRDFRGLSPEHFDQNGNYNFGLKEQLVFPEIQYDSIDKIRGFDISIVTTAGNKNQGLELLKEFNFPFTKN